MDFILVLANIEPKEGCQDSIIEVSKELIDESLLEEGNIDYQLLKPIEGDSLTFVEKWESLDALKRHMASPHFLNFGEESEEFVKEMTIQVIDADELSF
ncbi:putative quinol monooxygenase [uncultured Methanobrevibacter sp.]|jgi:quinol monooxygenase YgiN|uniref:putative quinol monooxygenase n=1 Tax=uncultured Methanobrevibacter sp. TaxID=253161 RepID=UPI0025F4478D|nr:antibiotic biosynthesis monooxygenase family protein [uncultured Methanobrevibacter sp.]